MVHIPTIADQCLPDCVRVCVCACAVTETEEDNIHLRMNDVIVQERGNYTTVAYFDTSNRRLFYPQGGRDAQRSANGVYWFPSQSAALRALKRVMHCYYNKKMR